MQVDKGGTQMIVPTMGRLTNPARMNNAAYQSMRASDAMLGLVSFAGSRNASLANIHAAEQRLTLSKLTNELIYKMAFLQNKSLKKLQDQKIKDTFSTFA